MKLDPSKIQAVSGINIYQIQLRTELQGYHLNDMVAGKIQPA